MKKAFLLSMVLAAVSLTACSQDPTSAGLEAAQDVPADSIYKDLAPVELILADSAGKDTAGQFFDELFARKLEEITDGRITVDLHLNGDLGGDLDLIRQMQFGDIDIVGSQIATLVSFIPEMAVFDLPMVFAPYSSDTIDQVLNGATDTNSAISAAYEAKGLKYLGILQNATYRLTTANVPLNTLEDFRRLQIRTMENSNHMAFWTAIGAEPTPLAWGEVYISLQNGTIDAQENAADTIVSANLYEVQKYVACTNHILYANQLAMNNDNFDALDPLYQEAIMEAAREAIKEMRPQINAIDTEGKNLLVEKGMTLLEYDDSFFREIQALDTIQDLYSAIDSQTGGLGATLQNELEAYK